MNIALILSGGTGSRLGSSVPKQYLKVGDKMIVEYVLDIFNSVKSVYGIVIVCFNEWIQEIDTKEINKPIYFATPGETRQLSILSGLIEIKNRFGVHVDNIIIHDAARPLVSIDLIESCISSCENGYDGAMPVLPVKDTIYLSNDGINITSLLERSQLFGGQAPEAFNFGKYLDAHYAISQEELIKINGSSELAFKQGMKIKLVPGDSRNFKITDMEDLERFKSICNESKCPL